jgi:hypothetical protein
MRKGFPGAKPERFCWWVMDLLGWKEGDQIDDLFPGTAVFDRVVADRLSRPPLPFSIEQTELDVTA